jgi:hypothetical protein
VTHQAPSPPSDGPVAVTPAALASASTSESASGPVTPAAARLATSVRASFARPIAASSASDDTWRMTGTSRIGDSATASGCDSVRADTRKRTWSSLVPRMRNLPA